MPASLLPRISDLDGAPESLTADREFLYPLLFTNWGFQIHQFRGEFQTSVFLPQVPQETTAKQLLCVLNPHFDA